MIKFFLYSIRALHRVILGRYYVWRDAPDDIVFKAASYYDEVVGNPNNPEFTVELFTQARDEAKLRVRQQTK